MDTIKKRPVKTTIDRMPVIRVCAARFSVPKKNVNPTVSNAPPNRPTHKMLGAMPVAR